MLGLRDVVELAVSSAELPVGKPDPLPFATTLSGLGLTAQDAFAVEDFVAGARSATSAGLFTIAVGPGCTGPADDFRPFRADSLAELTPTPATGVHR